MPTNDERREVAARLRELPIDMYEVEERWEAEGMVTRCKDQTDYYLIHFALFGCFPADHMHPCDYEELHARLADLIEPEGRTCRAEPLDAPVDPRDCPDDDVDIYEFRCSGCWALLAHDWRFCPSCGARAVHDA